MGIRLQKSVRIQLLKFTTQFTAFLWIFFLFLFLRMKLTICLALLAGSALLARCDPLQCDADTAQEVRIAAGEKIKEALVSENYPNNYPNNACQRWNIMAEENQV